MVILFCLTDKGKENYKFRGFLVPSFRDASPRISEVQSKHINLHNSPYLMWKLMLSSNSKHPRITHKLNQTQLEPILSP